MNSGRRCKYADECPVYNNRIEGLETPIHILRNVFCNRGRRGWENCVRYQLYESKQEVPETATPYNR